MKIRRLYVFSITVLQIFISNSVFAQEKNKKPLPQIIEIKGIYKSKIDGRIISKKEFNSYKGVYTFHKVVKAKEGKGRDTILITPPSKKMKDRDVARKKNFKEQLNRTAKNFDVVDLYGNKISLSALKGKIVVLNFWFVNCPPCKDEIPELNKVVAKYKTNDDVVFIGFVLDKKDKLNRFLSQTQFDYKPIPNSKNIANQYYVYAYPSHIIIDKNGVISHIDVGLKEGNISLLDAKITNTLNR
ncbi:peroxiredoxin [uncultured Psychroserpens sp.]|uniref:peroxiredoxin family protein n=1 Tax=uncultured Psychroserpens sp. TaxID=255436 RepID=UPI00261496C1|nr:TlpA disulfide reductase family protein [uncultured Psychroserpens sp.]